ncbi:hypothetical protein PR003_g32569, partial [Phytophthora rubi]
ASVPAPGSSGCWGAVGVAAGARAGGAASARPAGSMPPALPGRGNTLLGSWGLLPAAAGPADSSSSLLASSSGSLGPWQTARARAVAAASAAPGATKSGSLPAALPGRPTSLGGSWGARRGGAAGEAAEEAERRAWGVGAASEAA